MRVISTAVQGPKTHSYSDTLFEPIFKAGDFLGPNEAEDKTLTDVERMSFDTFLHEFGNCWTLQGCGIELTNTATFFRPVKS